MSLELVKNLEFVSLIYNSHRHEIWAMTKCGKMFALNDGDKVWYQAVNPIDDLEDNEDES